MKPSKRLASFARNKDNYLKAKAAFNVEGIVGCMQYCALDHQIMSRKAEKGRHEVEKFLASMHEIWSDLQVIVEHPVYEDDGVMGRSRSIATHNNTILALRLQARWWTQALGIFIASMKTDSSRRHGN